MKTIAKFVLFVFLTACPIMGWGQSSSAIAEYPVTCNSPKTIVRAWGNNVVSYLREGNMGYLYLTDITEVPIIIPPTVYGYLGGKIPLVFQNVEINDMQILNNKVFFCGNNQGSAIYGWVNLPFTSSSYLNYYTFPDSTNLNQMVVYKGLTGTKLVAIGENNHALYTKDVIIEIDNADGVSPSINLYELPYINDQRREILYDIVLTDDYVVFLGHDTHRGISLCTRWASRSNISGTIQNRYDYNLPQDEVHSELLATVVDPAKWIAVVYVHFEGPSNFTTRTRMIDVKVSHAIQYSQEYAIADKFWPYEISYNPTKQILTVLQNCTTPQDESRFRLLYPYATANYTFNTLYYPNLEFTSLCQLDKNRYVATGTNHSMTSKFWYVQDFTVSPSTTMSCPYLFNEKAAMLASPSVIYNPQQIIPSLIGVGYIDRPSSVSAIQVPLICNIPSDKK